MIARNDSGVPVQASPAFVAAVAGAKGLTVAQKRHELTIIAQSLLNPQETLGYTREEVVHLANAMICDLHEGHVLLAPRYIAPDFDRLMTSGCSFLELDPPTTLQEALDALLVFYHHVPSVTSFPSYLGRLDLLLEPFITDEAHDLQRIQGFLRLIDRLLPDSECHANIGPEPTRAGELILRATMQLRTTGNLSLMYDEDRTTREFAMLAAQTCLTASKPCFANDKLFRAEQRDYALCSCHNALPIGGGAHTLLRLRLGTVAEACGSTEEFFEQRLPYVADLMLSMLDKRVSFLRSQSGFFEGSFLAQEGFIAESNFTALFGIVGLANAVNRLLALEGQGDQAFGSSAAGDELAHRTLRLLQDRVGRHPAPGCERTGQRYQLHSQVGAHLAPADDYNWPGHRIPAGAEPLLPLHLTQASQFHRYFPSGVNDVFALDRTFRDQPAAVLDIIDGAFSRGCRYISLYDEDSDLVRVTGYLAKRSDFAKIKAEQSVLHTTTRWGFGMDMGYSIITGRRTRVSEEAEEVASAPRDQPDGADCAGPPAQFLAGDEAPPR